MPCQELISAWARLLTAHIMQLDELRSTGCSQKSYSTFVLYSRDFTQSDALCWQSRSSSFSLHKTYTVCTAHPKAASTVNSFLSRARLVMKTRPIQADKFAAPLAAEVLVRNLDQRSFLIKRDVRLFLQPVQLHFQLTDLRIQLRLQSLIVFLYPRPFARESVGNDFDGLTSSNSSLDSDLSGNF